MSTELQRQVATLKKVQVQSQSLKDGRASIFLTAKEAAGVDVSTVHEAAVTGLRVLSQYDHRFEDFLHNLLHPSSIEVQRELKTKEENEDLDKDIHRLLSLLSPWSFEPNAHLVLEYLVRRYRIHEFNVDALLRATLVAHDTKIFAKIVQLCKIVDTPWIFFIGVKESGVPIPRTEIVKRIIKTPWLLEALSDSVLSALKVAGVRKIGKDNVNVSNLTIQGVEKILSFFTAILIELAEMIPFDDGKMRSIYIFLSEGLKTHLNPSLNQAQIQLLTDWKNACCVIIAQLCRKTKFGGPLSKSLSKGLAMSLLNAKSAEMDANRQSIAFHVLVTSCILCQHNQLDVSLKYLSSLYSEEGNHSSSSPSSSSSATSWFLQSLQQMSTDYHTAAFVSSIAWCTFKALIQDKKDEEESDDSYLSSALLSQQLSRLIQHQLLATDVVKDIMQRLLSTHIQSEHWTSQDASLVDAIQRFVKSVSHWMPRIFDDAVTSSLQSCKDHAGKEKINLFLSQMFVERGNVVQFQTLTGDSLFMALNSPLKELRVQALHTYSKVSFIAEEQGSNESVGLAQAALRSVEDFDVTVVEAVFKANTIKTIVFNIAADEVFVTVKQALIHWIKYSVITTSAVGHEMLRVIVDALADQATLQRLLNSEGKLYEMLNMLVSLIFGEAFRQAQALLKSAVQLVKLISKEFSLFQNVDFSKVLSKNGALNVSVWMDATATELKKDEKSIAVVQGMFKQSPQHFADAADVVISLGVASFISKLVESLQGANLTQAQRILQSYLTPVVLRMINSLTATTEISSLHILPTLRNFFNVCGSINKVETKKDVDLMAFISSLALTQNASRVNFEVIEAILLSPNAAIVELIDVAMESMFPNAYNQLLLTLILDKNTHLSASQSAQIKTTSLQIFVMYVQSMLRKKASSDVDTHVILCSVAVLMWSCAHNHSSVRKLGVKLASVLQESFDSKQVLKWKKSSSLVQDLSLEGSALHIITKLIQDKESTIMLQSDALLHLVSEQLESNPKLKTFSETLWILVNVFGWTFDEFSKSLLCIVKHCTSLDFSWPILQHLLNALKDKAGNDTLIELILQAIEVAFTKAAVSTQEAIIKYSITILQSPNEDRIHYLKTNLLSLFAKGIIESSNNAAVHELYEVLMEQQLSRPGDVAVLDALAALNIEPSIPLELLLKEMKVVLALSEDGKDDKKSENDEDAMELDNHGFALPLQRLIALIEAAAPTIVKYKKVTDNELSSLVAALLEVLRITNLPAVKTVLSIEYYKAVVLEAAFQSLALMEKNEMLKSISGSTASVVATNKKDSKTKGKAAATSQTVSSSEKFQVYKLDRIEGDIKSIMNCLGSLRTSQVQTSAFGLLRILIRLKPSTALLTMQELGHLLSAATTAVVASREKFLSGILELLLGIMQEIPADSTDAQVSIQSIIQNLCVQLPAISLGHRSALLKSALKVLQHSHASSVAMVHVLLAHTLLAYESEQVFTQQKVESVENICFSRAAQRRAKRAMNSTGPEEFYSLSIQMFLEFDAAEQVQTLSVLLGTALDLTMLSVKDNNEVESNVINVDSTVSYMLQLLPSSKATNDMKFGYAATLALLHMEFVLEMMEHKKFHLSQAKALSRSNPINIQSHFLAIADTILRLVALTESTRKSNKITSGKDKMNLRMEDQVFSISVKSLMDIMTSWSLDALHCLQKLLDGPSFVSIVQELLNHELLSIRQKAVLVLKDRLQLMLQDKVSNNNEVTLYFDLSARMRSMISKFFQQHVQNDKNISEEISSARSSQSALVQSAIMCLDVLMQYLGKVATWKDELLAILAEFLEYVPVMYKSCSVESKLAVHAKPLELKKLLGSVLLACSTICKVLGAVTLPFFGKFMEHLIIIYTAENKAWFSYKSKQTNSQHQIDIRANVLFIRSVTTSCSMVVSALNTFVHPHIATLIPLLLDSYASFGLENIKDLKGLKDDASNCLSVIGNKVPARLLVPALSGSVEGFMKHGHVASLRLANLVLQVAKSNDRATVLSNLPKWISLSLELMDYRRKHGDYTNATDEVEDVVCESVVALCLKLTESELKAFILKVVEWRSSSENAKEKEKSTLSRSSSFYALIKTLVDHLKFLFYPTMALFWADTLEDLVLVKTKITKLIEAAANVEDSSAKKRKRGDLMRVVLNEDDQGMVNELLSLAKVVMSIIQSLCQVTSTVNFIHEKRFEETYSKIIAYFPLRFAFSDDESYLKFIQENSTATLAALCSTTTKDIMWKPINHQVWMQSRNSHPAVRIASVNTIKALFQEVGEEYLLLLPESLPYISELQEDDNHEVVGCTRELVSAIEEMTGEKLDDYLK